MKDALLLADDRNRGRNEIVVQAGILAAASIIVRIIGLLYQSPLTAIIGDEGNGYYSLAYNIYTIVLLISSYSIPSAISKLMSAKIAVGEYRNAQRIFRVCLGYCLAAGLLGAALLYFGAGFLVGPNSVPVLRVFAPTIFCFGILGSLRGYFQAHSSMLQTSLSQILEQIFNAAMSLFFAWLLMRSVRGQGTTAEAVYGAMGSALGTGSGVLAALIFMAAVYFLNRKRIRSMVGGDTTAGTDSYRSIAREVIRVVTPFILSSFVLNLTTSLNQTIYTKILMNARGFEEASVTMHYGIFSRKATVITNIPISIATATSAAVIPHISSAYATGDRAETKRRCRQAVWLTALIALPSTAGLIFLAEPVTMILFPQRSSLKEASLLLALLAVTVFFYSISTITTAILQSTEHMNLPLVNAGAALAVQTAVLVLLLRKTDLGNYALVAASIVYSVMIYAANEYFLRKYLGRGVSPGRKYLGPVLASLAMGIGSAAVYRIIRFVFSMAGFGTETDPIHTQYFANLIAFIPAFIAAVLIYESLLFALKSVTESDLLAMPKGKVLVRFAKKLRWIK